MTQPAPSAPDLAAFARVVEHHQALVCAVCRAMVGDAALSQDLAQDTFVVAWRRLADLRDPDKIGPWLAGIARNLCLNARRRAREVPVETVETDRVDGTPSVLDRAIAREALHAVREAIARMPESHREALILFYWEGRSGKQVAEQLGITEATANQRLSRARRYLHGELEATLAADLERTRPGPAFAGAVIALIAALGPGRAEAARAEATGASSTGGIALAGGAAVLALVGAGLVLLAMTVATPADPAAPPAVVHPRAAVRAPSIAIPNDGPGNLAIRVAGIVVDADDRPVAGATVAIDAIPPREAVTGSDGTFQLAGLFDRTYTLEARAQDQVSPRAMIRPGTPVTLRLGPGTTLAVQIVDEATRTPIGGARLELTSIGTLAAIADATGTATLRGLAPGSYSVAVSAGGYSAISTDADVATEPGTVETLAIALARGATVSGRLLRRGAMGTGAIGIAGVEIIAEPVFPSQFASRMPHARAVTGADGRWQIPALEAGRYRFVTAQRTASSEPVQLDGATARDGLTLELPDPVTLVGHVRTSDGQPAPAIVRVAIETPERSEPMVREVACDRDGRFEVGDLPNVGSGIGAGTGVPARSVVVQARTPVAASAPIRVDFVDLAARREIALVLDRANILRGRVVTATGAPLSSAVVLAVPDAPEAYAIASTLAEIADADGRFELHGLAAAPHVVRAAARGARDRTLASHPGVRATPGSDGELRVVAGIGILAGAVRFDDGTVPARFTVALPFADSAAFEARDGRFALRDLSAGTHVLAIRGPGFVDEQRTGIEVRDGETTELGTIVVRRGTRVHGRVLDASGSPVARATVLVGRSLLGTGDRFDTAGLFQATGGRTAITGSDGAFALEVASSDPLAIAAERPDLGRSAVAQVTPGDRELVLERTGALEGRIVRGGTAAPARIDARPHGAAAAQLAVTADEHGRYRYAALAPGEYRITAEYRGAQIASRAVVEAGRTATCDLTIAVGAEVSVRIAAPPTTGSMLVVLVSGDRVPESMAQLTSLDDVRKRVVFRIPGHAMNDAAKFADVPSGTYTACVPRAGGKGALVCQAVRVDGDRAVAVTLTP